MMSMWIFIAFFFYRGAWSSTNIKATRFWVENEVNATPSNMNTIGEIPDVSGVLECAILCERKQFCAKFVFDISGVCRFFDGTPFPPPGGMMEPKLDYACDGEYQAYIRHKTIVCFRHHPSDPVTRAAGARAACEAEGAQLLHIDTREMYELIVDMKRHLNWGQIFIQGKKNASGVFEAFDGTELFVADAPGIWITDDDQDCLRLSSDDEYHDNSCDSGGRKNWVCQKK